jgi:transcriptional regulator with XRE-family HTH domain
MAPALTRLGQICRDFRTQANKTMGDQADYFGCPIHLISAIEVGKEAPPHAYLEKFSQWLNLNEEQNRELVKRAPTNIIQFPTRGSVSNNSRSMRLFRKISKMDPSQIRGFRKKIKCEDEDD